MYRKSSTLLSKAETTNCVYTTNSTRSGVKAKDGFEQGHNDIGYGIWHGQNGQSNVWTEICFPESHRFKNVLVSVNVYTKYNGNILFYIQASVDNSSWNNISTISFVSYGSGSTYGYYNNYCFLSNITDETKYKYYRVYFPSNMWTSDSNYLILLCNTQFYE